MQLKRMLLMCSALITLSYSFPTDIQKDTAVALQNDTNLLNAKENEKSLVLIVERKDAGSDSVVLELVYTGNDDNIILQTTGNERDKYSKENPVKAEKNQKTNGDKRKIIQIPSTLNPQQRYNNKKKLDESKFQISSAPEVSLVPEEESSLSVKWPKYFSDAHRPIKPFPELELLKPKILFTDNAAKGNNRRRILNNGKERKEIPYVAGPQLNPSSIYDRGIYVSIFD